MTRLDEFRAELMRERSTPLNRDDAEWLQATAEWLLEQVDFARGVAGEALADRDALLARIDTVRALANQAMHESGLVPAYLILRALDGEDTT